MAPNLMAKAERAVASARALFELGDFDGACDRAYYAMFNAARAALLAIGTSEKPEIIRTHNGLIAAFSQQLVKTGRVPLDLGRALNRAEDLRLIADYKNESVDQEQSANVVQQAEMFVTEMRTRFLPMP